METFDRPLQSGVYIRQVQLLYKNQPLAVLSTALALVVLFVFLGVTCPWSELYVWMGLFALALTLRAVASFVYLRQIRESRIDYRRAELVYFVGVILTAGVWAGMLVILFPMLGYTEKLLLIAVVFALVTASHITMGYRKLPYQAYSLTILLAAIYTLYGSDFPGARTITLAAVMFTFFVLLASRNFYRSVENLLMTEEQSIRQRHKLLMQREQAHLESQAKTEFLSRMSHELRTPLNAVLGLNELQMRDQDRPLSPEQYKRARKMHDASNHLLALVNDVLDLSRIETDSLSLSLQTVDCRHLIDEALKLVEVKASDNNVRLEFPPSRGSHWVYADAQRMRQVIVNLLDNAIKYNRARGKVTVSLSHTRHGYLKISITDTGLGIPRESLGELFKPFNRLVGTREMTDGVGVGLVFSKKLVEMMNGRIGVDSQFGEGSCFWIEIPAAQPATRTGQRDDSEPAAAEPPADESAEFSVREGALLLVEDNLVNQEVAYEMLVDMGFEVDVAGNGIEALEKISDHDYAAILMDCQMPEMDGFTATRELRKREGQSGRDAVPVIALTAHAIQGAREQCLASGMDDFLSKPFSFDELHGILANWVKVPGRQPLHYETAADMRPVSGAPHVQDANSDGLVVIDPLALTRLHTGRINLVSRVVGSFLQQTPQVLRDIESSVRQHDVEKVSMLAHKLKSSSLAVGAVQVADSCRSMEALCEQGDVDIAEVDRLRECYDIARLQLNHVMLSDRPDAGPLSGTPQT